MAEYKIKIVAEIGCNHCGRLETAIDMIQEAKNCGCDYVKFQKRSLGSIPQEIAERPYLGENSFGQTYLAHRAALEFDGMAWRTLQSTAERIGIGFFGTAFDLASAEFLANIDLPYLKIGSGQVRDLHFLQSIADLPLLPPIIASTGMCSYDQVAALYKILPIQILCHSVSSYPCPENEVNLMAMLISPFANQVEEIGLSGHYTAGNGAIEAAAVALGATYIERHFTLDRTWKGTDQAASLEPAGMANVVKAVRQVERAMGNGIKKLMPSEVSVLLKQKN